MKNIGIVGVTNTGNMGGQAMLLSTIQATQARYPHAKLTLFSLYPEADKSSLAKDSKLAIEPMRPIFLLLFAFPLSLFAMLCPTTFLKRIIKKVLVKNRFFSAMAKMDILVDISGVAFVDGRGFALLCYNAALSLPALASGTPVYKLAQTIGPCRNYLNRHIAFYILSRCQSVVARGEQSYKYASELNLPFDVKNLPDTAFCLNIKQTHFQQAAALTHESKSYMVICPSEVLRRYCSSNGQDLVAILSTLIQHIIRTTEYKIFILIHSRGERQNKNSDQEVCDDLHKLHKDENRVSTLEAPEDYLVLKAVISNSQAFVGCRYHSLVSSLGSKVPSIAIGWNHKYVDLLKLFQCEEFYTPFENLSERQLINLFDKLINQRQSIGSTLTFNHEEISRRAENNFQFSKVNS